MKIIDFSSKMQLTQTVNHLTELQSYANVFKIVLMKHFLHDVMFFLPKIKILICLGDYSKTNAQAAPKLSSKYHQNPLKILDFLDFPDSFWRILDQKRVES